MSTTNNSKPNSGPIRGKSKKLPRGKAFAKGISGNPAGRPKLPEAERQARAVEQKVIQDVKKLAQEHTDTALATLVDIMTDKDAPKAARVGAANSLLDRGWGKPTQPTDVTVKKEVRQLSDEEILDLLSRQGVLSDEPVVH